MKPRRPASSSLQRLAAGATLLVAVLGCRPDPAQPFANPTTAPRPPGPSISLRPEPIGTAASSPRPPWIAHVAAADLDRDGRLDVLACDAQENQLLWLRQTTPGRFQETILRSDLKAPVHADAIDLDGDGDLDIAVASMGFVFPNNDRIGTVFLLENDGRQNFSRHAVLEHTDRVTDVRAADFNADGRVDLAVAQFGYDQGTVSWLERTGPWQFRRHVLLELSGAINVCVADFNGDKHPDLVALVSQQWEEIYCFENDGRGAFTRKRIWGSTNEDFGSSGISVADVNGDGRPDILYTNGDGFGPAVMPGPRPWHGVQWLENVGDGTFRYHRIGDLPGAYSPLGVDLDGDGATDIVAVAAYAGRNNPGARTISLAWFRNEGRDRFTRHVLAVSPKDQIALAAGDFDATGRRALVTGGFYVSPPYRDVGRITLWRP